MRLIPVADIKKGMVLAQTIYGDDGNVWLQRNAELSPQRAQLLARRGIRSIYVDPNTEIEVPELIKREIRAAAGNAIKDSFEAGRLENTLNTPQVRKVVSSLLDELLANPFAVHAMSEIRSVEGYFLGHSITVATLSILMGMSLGYPPDKLHELGASALLHDIGNVNIPSGILSKTAPLNEDERKTVQQHAVHGFSVMRQQKDLSILTAHVAFQHHERLDGSGYPRQLKNDKIIPYARIVAVADMYDALTSDRPHRFRLRPDEALKLIMAEAGSRLDAEACAVLQRRVAIYPPGTKVRLSTGELGMVTLLPPGNPGRPDILVFADRSNKKLPSPYVMSLLEKTDVQVRGVIGSASLAPSHSNAGV